MADPVAKGVCGSGQQAPRRTRKSAILVEMGFLDTEKGQRFLTDPANQERLAQAIARGTLRHHGLDRAAPTKVVSLTLEERVTRLEKLHPELV